MGHRLNIEPQGAASLVLSSFRFPQVIGSHPGAIPGDGKHNASVQAESCSSTKSLWFYRKPFEKRRV